jgi:nicotinamidase/pyrazinamidase
MSAALLVIDCQNSFMPGGELPVPFGDTIVPIVCSLTKEFNERKLLVVASIDCHPANHCSFVEQGGQWPAHCVQGTDGALLHKDVADANYIVKKGTNPAKDSYSAFYVDGEQETGLNVMLQKAHVDTVFICGLALEYCVCATYKDAKKLGYDAYIVLDATKAVMAEPKKVNKALKKNVCFSWDVHQYLIDNFHTEPY